MLDFSSSLYLGLRYPRASLGDWASLTTGRPAVLGEPAAATWLGAQTAGLQGCEAGVVAPSTFHLYWDIFGILGRERPLVLADQGVYPIGKWGIERSRCRGSEVRWFAHGNVRSARDQLANENGNRRVLLVTDALTAAGVPVDLGAYLKLLERFRGEVLIDNTQALGVYGARSNAVNPYGEGGGGILRYWGIEAASRVILVSSLAKAFGVPIAVGAGSQRFVAEFASRSETREHCSPPSAASLRAGRMGMTLNQRIGDRLRKSLLENVRLLSDGLSRLRLRGSPSVFPVQTVASNTTSTQRLHEQLTARGFQAVLVAGVTGHGPVLKVIIRADHSSQDIEGLLAALAAIEGPRRRTAHVRAGQARAATRNQVGSGG